MQAKTGNKDWVRMKGKDRLGLYEGKRRLGSYAVCENFDWVPMQEGVLLPRTFGNTHDGVPMQYDWVPMQDDWVPMQKTHKVTC